MNEELNTNEPVEVKTEENKPETQTKEKSVSEVVLDKKGQARLKSLEEKNQSLEQKIEELLKCKGKTEEEILQIKGNLLTKTPEQKKSYLAELNEHINSIWGL